MSVVNVIDQNHFDILTIRSACCAASTLRTRFIPTLPSVRSVPQSRRRTRKSHFSGSFLRRKRYEEFISRIFKPSESLKVAHSIRNGERQVKIWNFFFTSFQSNPGWEHHTSLKEHSLHRSVSPFHSSTTNTHPKQFKQCVWLLLLPEQNPGWVQTTSSLKSPTAAHIPRTTTFRCKGESRPLLSSFSAPLFALALIRKIVAVVERFCSFHPRRTLDFKYRPLLLQTTAQTHSNCPLIITLYPR